MDILGCWSTWSSPWPKWHKCLTHLFIPCFGKASEHCCLFPRCIQVLINLFLWKVLSLVVILLDLNKLLFFIDFWNLFFGCSCYEDYLAASFPLGLYKQIFLPSEMAVLSASLGASTCIFSSDILHDEKVIDQVHVFLLFYSHIPFDVDQKIWYNTFSWDANVVAIACAYQLWQFSI